MVSNEHKEYLKKLKRQKIIICICRLLIIFSFIIIWQILANAKIVNTFLFSSPNRIINTLISLIKDNNLFKHVYITLYEVILSLILGISISFLVSTIFWRFEIISKIMDPYITILNSLPKVALGPLIIIWIGTSSNSIVFMALLISIFITIINIYNGFISVDKSYVTLMKSFNASKWQIFWKVILPSNYKTILSSLKIAISMDLIGCIMGELLVSKKGLGYLIMYGTQVFNIDLVISSIFLLGIMSYLMYYIITIIEKKLTR